MIPFVILTIEDDSDREFMEQFYKEFKNLMYFTASKYINDSHIVDEIVHDVIVSFIKKIKEIRARERCTLPGYVVISVRRHCYNYLKHRKVEMKHQERMAEDPLVVTDRDSIEAIENELLKKYDIDKMMEALRLLPERMQELLEFKYFLEMPDNEIAELMDIKKNSVRQALTRARRALYKKMKEIGHE